MSEGCDTVSIQTVRLEALKIVATMPKVQVPHMVDYARKFEEYILEPTKRKPGRPPKAQS